MSGVDVLAVMDVHIAAMAAGRGRVACKDTNFYYEARERFQESRAAVAELIEAADAVQSASAAIEDAEGEYCPVKVPMDVQSNLNRALFAAQDRFDAALRRVKGESE